MGSETLPVACTLTEVELRERREGVLRKVRGAVAEVKEVADGYAYRLPADGVWLSELAQLVNLERQCCPFLTFRITAEPAGGPLWLEVTGPPGTKDFLASTFG